MMRRKEVSNHVVFNKIESIDDSAHENGEKPSVWGKNERAKMKKR